MSLKLCLMKFSPIHFKQVCCLHIFSGVFFTTAIMLIGLSPTCGNVTELGRLVSFVDFHLICCISLHNILHCKCPNRCSIIFIFSKKTFLQKKKTPNSPIDPPDSPFSFEPMRPVLLLRTDDFT